MRAFVITLLIVAAPIYFGATMFGGSGLSLGDFSSFSDVRRQIAASDFAHNAMIDARDYAAAHPGLVEGLKAHRAEIKEFRDRLCSMVSC
ncbi:MAG TPA: hypothetical protein VKV32_09270 [Stellaceae bacterium]|nr:hypothetical protein [Stellaceae bacterium]